MSATGENGAIATLETEATRTLGVDPQVSRGWLPQRQVARDLGVGGSTVSRAVASQRPPKYKPSPVPTSFVPFEPLVQVTLAEHPDMPATVIAERVGWTGSITWFRDNVRRLRPVGELGPVPRPLIWDNEPSIGRGNRHAERVAGFTGTLATTLVRLRPRDRESKGIVERRNGFFETSIMPGRDFTSPADYRASVTG